MCAERREKVTWDSFRTKTLIVEYEKYEHLYNVQHEFYRNKKFREETLAMMANTLNQIWGGMGRCTSEDIKKKLNGLRSQYLFERQKIARARAQGETYKPTIYWYSMLSFLEPVTKCQIETTSSPPVSKPTSTNTSNTPNFSDRLSIEIKEEENSRSPSTASSTSSYVDVQSYLQRETRETTKNTQSTSTPKRKLEEISFYVVNNDSKNACTSPQAPKRAKLSSSELSDHLETFGKFVADELRGIYISSSDIFMRRTKRQLQQVLIDAWTQIEMDESRYPSGNGK